MTIEELEAQYDRQIRTLGALTTAKTAAKKAGASREELAPMTREWLAAQEACDATLADIERARLSAGLSDEE